MVNDKDNKKRETSGALCSCSPPSDQFLIPFLNPDHLPFQVTPPTLFTGHVVLWCGVSLWSVRVGDHSYALSQFHLLIFSLAQCETREEVLDLR